MIDSVDRGTNSKQIEVSTTNRRVGLATFGRATARASASVRSGGDAIEVNPSEGSRDFRVGIVKRICYLRSVSRYECANTPPGRKMSCLAGVKIEYF